MKAQYFQQNTADADDMMLGMAKMQGYVPRGCLLGGMVVMAEVQNGRSPCDGCSGPREKCGGKPRVYDDGFWANKSDVRVMRTNAKPEGKCTEEI